jgi:protein TonB
MHNFIIDNLVIPESSISGARTIIVEFMVQSNGMISTISFVKAFDENIGLDVLRIISEMPNWTPGKCSGKSVPVKFTLALIIN